MSIKGILNHKIIQGSFHSSQEGVSIAYRIFRSQDELPKRVIHLIFQHGAAEYYYRHLPLFESLIKAFGKKVVITSMDLIGHGKSGGSRAYVENYQTYISDFLKLVRVQLPLYEEHDVKTFFMGHSLGGAIIIKSLVDHEKEMPINVDAVILSNPAIRTKIQLPAILAKPFAKLGDKWGKVRFPTIYGGFSLTTDVERAISFDNDDLNTHFMTLKMMSEVSKLAENISSHSYYLKTPTFFLLSGDDELIDIEMTKLFMTGIDKKYVEKKCWQNAKHDLLNETCRQEVFSEVIQYIKRRIK